jgi:hypothetical protein
MKCFHILSELIPDALELPEFPVQNRELQCYHAKPLLGLCNFKLFRLNFTPQSRDLGSFLPEYSRIS